MSLLVVHPWAQFFAGMLIGCWVGAAVASGGLLLMVGRRIRHLESLNVVLRKKLKARYTPKRTAAAGSGPMLVMPLPDSLRKTGSVPGRNIARVN